MSSQAQNSGNLGRGMRTKKPTAKGQAYASTISRRGAAHGITPSHIAVQGTSQVQVPAQGITQSQVPTQAQTDRRITRSQTRTQAGLPAQANVANNTQGQTNAAANGTQLAPEGSTRKRARQATILKAKIDGLMIKIYEEIRRAAIDKLSSHKDEIYAVREFLFQARLRRFFDLQPEGKREVLLVSLEEYDVHHPRGGSVANDARRALLFPEPDRLTEFFDDPKLLLLTFCAHSASFREAIRRSDAQSREEGAPAWSDIYPVLKSCASSLELFAQSFDFNWEKNLRAFEKHFDTILKYVYSDEQRRHRRDLGGLGGLGGIDQSNFGIDDGDLAEIHQIADEEESYIHHHWALPSEDKQPAVRPTIKYTVTGDMWRAPFVNDFYAVVDRPRIRRKGKKAKLPVTLPPGSEQTLKQLDITKSVILDMGNHPWPLGASSNVLGRPDFCGAPGHKCIACGVEAPDAVNPPNANAEDGADAGESSTAGQPLPEPERAPSPEHPYPCHCTLKELMAVKNDKKTIFTQADSLLVELFTTHDKGRGIRSLQRIPRGTFIGQYIGETYPERDLDTGSEIFRYGGPEGNVYHFSVPLGAPPPPRTPDRRPHFTVDSAHLGNWTRFMNHHCSPNVRFETVNLGQVWTTVVRTVKEIKFREEITTDYGPDYFHYQGLDCRCGHARCKYSNVSGKRRANSRKRARDGDDEHSGSENGDGGEDEDEDEEQQKTERKRKRAKTVAKKGSRTKAATKGRDVDVRPTGKSKGKGKAAKKGGKRR